MKLAREDFSSLLMCATESVAKHYFQSEIIASDGLTKVVYRERVYCYELYHQLRRLWPEDGTLVLHGEYDKSGSQVFSGAGISNAKPDFLIHKPGSVENNLVVMEVKPAKAGLSRIMGDYDKLRRICQSVRYSCGVLLVFGKGSEELVERVVSDSKQVHSNHNVEIWTHEEAGHPARMTS